ncbi:DUF6445 family protein [Sphingomonas corticis]|jgi:hypothetical protein|uniref:Uncharacterized protein n=1 Tax=Sphingomonas corticis TaxID=2722791 RepID=A0ABX1CST7_9SPHN|nr:DUF6445 family protein [Sphingomonas corticis]NJR79477.1 hypothetical protein [Sphingomonas corticis]
MPVRFPLSDLARTGVRRIGHEREPLLVIDGAMAQPAALVEAAAASDFQPAYGPAGGYPGLRAAAPLDYVGDMVRVLARGIVAAFALDPAARPRRAECNFSLVTLPPDRLVPTQRAPHVDTADPHQFAILHYLCDPAFGGTAFFRHRATGFEALTPDRLPAYEAARAAEAVGQGYAGDDAAFRRIDAVEAAFDRVVVYRSRLLHSGIIREPSLLTDDPRTGRLTANIFLTLR